MKGLWPLCLMGALLLIPLASAAMDWQATWEEICDCCAENHTVNFTISIENTGTTYLFVNSLEVRFENGTVIAKWDKVDNDGENLSVGEDDDFLAEGVLPFEGDDEPYHTVCIYAEYLLPDLVTLEKKWDCASDYELLDIVDASQYECDSSAECENEEYCKVLGECHTECANVTPTSSCGNYTNHTWVDYECCSSSVCTANETCSNHICMPITCVCGKIFNHQCEPYECCANSQCQENYYCSENHVCLRYECSTDSECPSNKKCEGRKCVEVTCTGCNYASEHTCKPHECCNDGSCADDKKCENNKCVQVRCASDEYPSGHACVEYECMGDTDCSDWQSCVDHSCVGLTCKGDEVVGNHTCTKFGCGMFAYPKKHACVSYFSGEGIGDNPIPLILLIALMSAVGFLFLVLLRKSRPQPGEKVERTKKGHRVRKKFVATSSAVSTEVKPATDEELKAIKKALQEETDLKELVPPKPVADKEKPEAPESTGTTEDKVGD